MPIQNPPGWIGAEDFILLAIAGGQNFFFFPNRPGILRRVRGPCDRSVCLSSVELPDRLCRVAGHGRLSMPLVRAFPGHGAPGPVGMMNPDHPPPVSSGADGRIRGSRARGSHGQPDLCPTCRPIAGGRGICAWERANSATRAIRSGVAGTAFCALASTCSSICSAEARIAPVSLLRIW